MVSEEASAIIDDIVSRMMSFPRTISNDSVSISDTIARITALTRESTVAAGAIIFDESSRLTDFARGAADSIMIGDDIVRFLIFSRLIQDDGAVISETLNKLALFLRDSTEDSDALLTDNVSRASTLLRESVETSESIVADGIARLAIVARDVTESSGSLILDFVATLMDAFEPNAEEKPRNNRGGSGGDGPRVVVRDDTYFATNPLQRIVFPSVLILDSEGAQFNQIRVGEQVQIVTVIENRQKHLQDYVIAVQIVDENNVSQEIILAQGAIEYGRKETLTLYWAPSSPGKYMLGIFVIDKLDTNFPQLLSQKVNKGVTTII
jgi:hypothetical protein